MPTLVLVPGGSVGLREPALGLRSRVGGGAVEVEGTVVVVVVVVDGGMAAAAAGCCSRGRPSKQEGGGPRVCAGSGRAVGRALQQGQQQQVVAGGDDGGRGRGWRRPSCQHGRPLTRARSPAPPGSPPPRSASRPHRSEPAQKNGLQRAREQAQAGKQAASLCTRWAACRGTLVLPLSWVELARRPTSRLLMLPVASWPPLMAAEASRPNRRLWAAGPGADPARPSRPNPPSSVRSG